MVASPSTPPSTVDAISGDDMESASLESGIEGSIKRCEALLSMIPVTLGNSSSGADALHESSNKKLRKARAYLNMNMKNLMEGLEPEWNKNMGLLSSISMSRDMSSSPASSWQSYSLCNDTSTQRSYNPVDNNLEREAQPAFMCSASVTRSRTSKEEVTHHQRRCIKNRYPGGSVHISPLAQDWTESLEYSMHGTSQSSAMEEDCPSFNPSEDVSNGASSDSGESAESAVTDSYSKNLSHEKLCQPDGLELEKPCQPDAVPSMILPKERNEQESLEEESLEEELGSQQSHRPSEITISLPKQSTTVLEWQGDAASGSIATGDALPQASPQSEQPEKHSSCSSSTTSEPNMMDTKKFTPQANKNAAELKPTGLPTNYRKTDTPPTKGWSSSRIVEESQGKHKGKVSRHGRLKTHTVQTMARLSTPKTLASAQWVSRDAKSASDAKRSETPVKPETVMRVATPKIMATQKVCHMHNSRTSPEAKPREGRTLRPGSKCSTPFVERLGDIQERINSSKRAKKIREKEERDMCSFRPNINTKYLDVEAYQPIEKRLDCIREEKDRTMRKARDQEAKDLGITFRPQLNPTSVRILKERGKSPLTLDIGDESGNTSPRTSFNCWSELSDLRAKAADASRSASVCTFVPEINANTHAILAGTAHDGCDFLTRQQQFIDRIEQRKRLKQQDLPPDFTFQPERGNANFILTCSPLYKTDENVSEMCERLSSSDNQRRLCIQQQITDNYYSQFAFHPHIDETSRLLGRNPSFETLYTDQRAKHHKNLLERLAQEEFQRTCTFRPVVKRTPTFPTEEAVLEERKQIKQERKKQEDKERIMKELEELAECTFKPVINPWPPKEVDTGLQIKGVQRHLELQRLAKQMKIDQAEWEKKIFFSHQNNERPKQQYTIPKPFNFHTGSCNDHCPGSPVNRSRRVPPSTPIDPRLST